MTGMNTNTTQQVWARMTIAEFQDALRSIPADATVSDLRAEIGMMIVVMRRVVEALSLTWDPDVTFADQVVDAIHAWKTKAGEGGVLPSDYLERVALNNPELANDLAFWQITAINLAGAWEDHCEPGAAHGE